MKNPVKTYYLAPKLDWAAVGGPVRLGSIITGPARPDLAVDKKPFELPQPVNYSKLEAWTYEDSGKRKLLAGLFCRFLEATIGVDFHAKLERTQTKRYQFDRLVTMSITPDVEYVKSRLEDDGVRELLEANNNKAYIITGLKIACNPSGATSTSRMTDTRLRVGANLAAAGVPLTVGPELEASHSTEQSTSFVGGTDIIFAFEIQKIRVKWYKNGRAVTVTPRNKGAFMSHPNGEDDGKTGGSEDELTLEVAEITSPKVDGGEEVLDAVEGECQAVNLRSMEPWCYMNYPADL
ncbi:hypothetical protein EJ06DRAFT_527112 [Trichodelitschia bisporula]|uniref:Uncharacterized protein n=1 Tax=Trichodelitschia bisporula TaxID=703511 RepID=A0A6G1I5M7_9PEZI|nr:hypothetical protein EJ06DRAFT_527112 [Trichodelitschia bisporula]